MRAIIVYESMYGNTRHVAEAVARGLDEAKQVRLAPVSVAEGIDPGEYDLIVVGGPTHRYGMSRESTRRAARDVAAASGTDLTMEPTNFGYGLRERLESLSGMNQRAAAAFDTRRDYPPLVTGSASNGISKLLRAASFQLVAKPESFLVDGNSHLLPGEEERAQAWGALLAARISG